MFKQTSRFASVLAALFAAPAFSDTEVTWAMVDGRLVVVVDSPARFAFARSERVFDQGSLPAPKSWRPMVGVEDFELSGTRAVTDPEQPHSRRSAITKSAG